MSSNWAKDRLYVQLKRWSGGNVIGKVSRQRRRERNRDNEAKISGKEGG